MILNCWTAQTAKNLSVGATMSLCVDVGFAVKCAGPTHTNVIFDAVLPYDISDSAEIKAQLEQIVQSLWENACPKITIDRPYT